MERTKIGKRAFVGNSGMTAPGRKVPKQSLVAVLSVKPDISRPEEGVLASHDRERRLERGHAVHVSLRCLHGDRVLNALLRIEPEARGSLPARRE